MSQQSSLLEQFYTEVKNKNGDDYQPESLKVIITVLEIHLNDKG